MRHQKGIHRRWRIEGLNVNKGTIVRPGLARATRSNLARRAWPTVRNLVQLSTMPRRDRCLIISTSALTHEYINCLIPALEDRQLEFNLLDLSSRRHQFRISAGEYRALSAEWGAAVSFDHSKWPTRAPEIRLPHGIRSLANWSHASRQLLLPSGEPRYRAIGLPDQASISEMTRRVPQVDASSISIVGELRADRFLSQLANEPNNWLGVFSGWKATSMVPTLGSGCISEIERTMVNQDCEKAVMTVHPRVATLPQWAEVTAAIRDVPWICLVSDNDWETPFASCKAYFGDSNTSMWDLLALTHRPVKAFNEGEGMDFPPAIAVPGWPVGLAADLSADLVVNIMGSARH